MPSRTLPEGSSLFGYVLVFDSIAEQVLRMMLRTCCALAEAPFSSGNPCRRVTLRIHRGVRACQGKPDPETISGSRNFWGLVLTPRVLKSGKFLITGRFCLRGLLGTGSVRAETCYVGCSVLSHRACGG